MDIGFGALLEKCEAYFGVRLTKLFVLLIVLCVALVLAAQAWKQAIAPAVRLLFSIRFDGGLWYAAWIVGGLAASITVGVVTSSIVSISFARWKWAKDAREDVTKAKQLLSDIKAYREEVVAQTGDALDRAQAVLAKANDLSLRGEENEATLNELFARAKKSLGDRRPAADEHD